MLMICTASAATSAGVTTRRMGSVALNDGDRHTGGCKPRSQGRACLPGPDDDCIEMPRHESSFREISGHLWPAHRCKCSPIAPTFMTIMPPSSLLSTDELRWLSLNSRTHRSRRSLLKAGETHDQPVPPDRTGTGEPATRHGARWRTGCTGQERHPTLQPAPELPLRVSCPNRVARMPSSTTLRDTSERSSTGHIKAKAVISRMPIGCSTNHCWRCVRCMNPTKIHIGSSMLASPIWKQSGACRYVGRYSHAGKGGSRDRPLMGRKQKPKGDAVLSRQDHLSHSNVRFAFSLCASFASFTQISSIIALANEKRRQAVP